MRNIGNARLPEIRKSAVCFFKKISWLVSKVFFRCKVVRNELETADKNKPVLIIANHESALDFINIVPYISRKLYTIISHAFYETIPFKKVSHSVGLIPKQQFQTAFLDLVRMKEVMVQKNALLIFPAGLMCENGLSTPIPKDTYRFVKFMDADVYVARLYGNYFVNAKWRKGLHPGKTYLDIHRIFTQEEVQNVSIENIRESMDKSLLFDAYKEQEELKSKFKGNCRIKGLENVLYACPCCGKEYSTVIVGKNSIRCNACGYTETSDIFGFLHCENKEREIRHVSDWDLKIYDDLKKAVIEDENYFWEEPVEISMLEDHHFKKVGTGVVRIDKEKLTLTGVTHGQLLDFVLSTKIVYSLPFKPGQCFDIQNQQDIYRCFPKNGRSAMKFIHLIKIFHELATGEEVKKRPLSSIFIPFNH